jgi:exopolyphosphatase / guanosine-5'-triphosphate,3'-diphosphate pyrophosphatase
MTDSRTRHLKQFDRRPVAVVDIGSNSIRLVVFDGTSRVPLPLFNEKVLCGLGRGLERTGALDAEGMDMAFANLKRFAELVRAMGVRKTFAIATAAARDASNGARFVAQLRAATGLPVRVLSGSEEARLSALGVLAGMPEASGAMGDLGGGSLELVGLGKGKTQDYATLPLGPLRLRELADRGRLRQRDMIDEHLAGLRFLPRAAANGDFYAVGGAWRALAKLHMSHSGYALDVIHHYAIAREPAIEFLALLSTQSRASLEGFMGVSRKRIETLPVAALVLERTLRRAKPKRLVFSAYGLREGALYDSLPGKLKKVDPLLSGAQAMLAGNRRYKVDPEQLADWVEPLFKDKTRRRLRLAAAYLADIAWSEHPDHRGEIAYRRALYMPVGGIDHPGRAYVALALFARYEGEPDMALTKGAWALLDESALSEAYLLGLALRVAYRLSGGASSVLDATSLKLVGKALVLEMPKKLSDMVGDVVGRRLDALARALDRRVSIKLR